MGKMKGFPCLGTRGN